MVTGILVASAIAIGAIFSGCGDDNCNIAQMKSCSTHDDCVLVGCGCCYDGTDEAVRRECKDTWYRIQNCKPGTVICLAIACSQSVECEDNQCVVR